MLKLKTKTPFTVPCGRGTKEVIVRLIIDKLEIDENNVNVKGYYYYIDEFESVIRLDTISENPYLWDDIAVTELDLSVLESTENIKPNLIQRLKEFTLLKIESEPLENYGTIHTDWEDDLQEYPIIEE